MAAPAQLPEHDHLYRIGDVSRLTDTKPFVLRFWETEFPMLQPVKAPKGHRLYRREDIDLIRAIKRLLYEEGFTIAGARRHLAEMLANGESWAAFLDRPASTMRVAMQTPAVAMAAPVPASSLFPNDLRDPVAAPLAIAPTRAVEANALPQAHPKSSDADLHEALLATRDELRAILTLLGTR